MRPEAPIAILLSTFNGQRFLQAQLDSLWQQTRQDFVLHVRDDGSSDNTLQMLADVRQQRPGQVQLIRDAHARLGPKRSFAALMQGLQAPYVAFCDQDDVWLPDKLARQVQSIQAIEAKYGTELPILCCSDATVTDSNLHPLHASYHRRHKLQMDDGRDMQLQRLLFRNYAIGATTMVNGALVQRCQTVPDAIVMHDWWMALVATALGQAIALPDALVLYRQHNANAVGSRAKSFPRTLAEFTSQLDWARKSSVNCLNQAVALHALHAGSATPQAAALLRAFAGFPGQGMLTRLHTLLRTRAFKPGFALNGLHLFSCMTADMSDARVSPPARCAR